MEKYILQSYQGNYYTAHVNNFDELKSLPYWDNIVCYTLSK